MSNRMPKTRTPEKLARQTEFSTFDQAQLKLLIGIRSAVLSLVCLPSFMAIHGHLMGAICAFPFFGEVKAGWGTLWAVCRGSDD